MTQAASLRKQLLAALRPHADPSRAKQAQAYMKSAMPFLGVALPELRRVAKALFKELRFDDQADFEAVVRGLWDGAEVREERYATLTLLSVRATKPFRTTRALPLYQHLVRTGAWWDLVDELAAHRLGELLDAEPAATSKAMRAWSRDEDLWVRRASIICQIHRAQPTDVKLLFDCMEPSLADKDFFARKAIGWALRTLAAEDATAVKTFLAGHDAVLSGLSKREARKGLDRVARTRASRTRASRTRPRVKARREQVSRKRSPRPQRR